MRNKESGRKRFREKNSELGQGPVSERRETRRTSVLLGKIWLSPVSGKKSMTPGILYNKNKQIRMLDVEDKMAFEKRTVLPQARVTIIK